MGRDRPFPRLQHPGGPPALPVAAVQPQDRGRLARTPAPTLIVRDSRLQGLHNTAEIVHTALSRDQPVPRTSKRESLHRTQGGPVPVITPVFDVLLPQAAARARRQTNVIASGLDNTGDLQTRRYQMF